jgi:hypothetical protein
MCRGSTGGSQRPRALAGCGENFLYVFKGARSAPRALRRVVPREVAAVAGEITDGARRGGRKRPRDTHRDWTGSSALAPCGARRAAARALPRAPPVTGTAAVTPADRAQAGTAILPAPTVLSRARSPSRALRPAASASHAMAFGHSGL